MLLPSLESRKSPLGLFHVQGLIFRSAMFEYKNEFFALRTPAEIRGWIADRKKWYPTAARVAEKQAEQKALQEKRKQNLEEKRQKIHIERFEWPLAAAILFLMWEFLISERARALKAESPRQSTRRRSA